MKFQWFFFFAPFLVASCGGGGESGSTQTQVAAEFTQDEAWITGLSNATAFAETPDGRLLVAQQGGALRVVKNAALVSTPMLIVTVDPSGERGLLGVAVHPNFSTNGYVYVYYTSTETTIHNRVSRFTVAGDTATGEEKLINLPALSSATNHNGGAIHFGSDGKLYVGVGDNANGANSQNLASPLGKMLRFNDDGSIPNDNPFCTTNGNLACAVWAYGLRNPFTFAVHPGSGRIHINDVGQVTWEEINLGSPAANYGRPGSEGFDGVTAGITAPILAYRHPSGSPPGPGPGSAFTGFAIAGGAFYPDSGPFPPEYRDNYYFADFGSKFVGRFNWVNNTASRFTTVLASPVDVLVGSDGAVYVLTRSGVVRISVK